MRLLGEEALARLPAVVEGQVETPCGVAEGLVTVAGPPVCVVSIVRSGDILQEAVDAQDLGENWDDIDVTEQDTIEEF